APLRYALGDDVAVSVDPVQIQQVIVNLVKNALDAARDPAGCEIVIATSVTGSTVAIQVEDNGHGIASDILETLFESFVTSKSDGMGVGLSISRTIVEAHGGKIAAANRAGGGAIFTVTLPIAAIG
ncbi:MAG: ATP-binding protein, partial [Pseudomonadota bacterium]|nr:ATP-binding protein [Pseudomonadota bacterium]